MVISTYILRSSSHSSKELLDTVRSVVNPLQFNKNCLNTGVWQNVDDPNQIMVYEIWKSLADLEKYLSSHLYKRMLEVIEMSIEKPEIRFVESETVFGLEWLEKLIVVA